MISRSVARIWSARFRSCSDAARVGDGPDLTLLREQARSLAQRLTDVDEVLVIAALSGG